MGTSGCLSDAEIIDFQDGQLTTIENARISRHIAMCDICRDRVRASDEIGSLLRMHAPINDISIDLASIRSSMDDVGHRPNHGWLGVSQWRSALVGGLGIILIIVGLTHPVISTAASNRLDSVVTRIAREFTSQPESQLDNQPPQSLMRARPVNTYNTDLVSRIEILLPLNLRLSQQHISNGILDLRYSDSKGRIIDIRQKPSVGSPSMYNSAFTEETIVDRVEVILEQDSHGRLTRLQWVHDDIHFEITAGTATSASWEDEALLEIVRAIISDPDNP